MQMLPIHTNNYTLRSISHEDAVNLFEIMGDAETMKYITSHPVQSIEEMEEKINTHLENFQLEKEIPWVIIDNKNERVIGMFRFHKVNMWHRKAEMGVAIHRDYQRKGLMTELMPEILRYGFEILELNRIVGDIFADNTGSRKILEKFGFKKEGVLRQTDFDGENFHDTVVYSMLRSEYQ